MAKTTLSNENAAKTIMTRSNSPTFNHLHLLKQIHERIKWSELRKLGELEATDVKGRSGGLYYR
jgi:hypothetical protein